MKRVVVWNEPLCLDPDCVINSVVRAHEEDVIRWWKHTHKEHDYTDSESLEEFIIVNWAWLEPYDPKVMYESNTGK